MALSVITQGLGTFGDVHHVVTWGLLPAPITSTITQLCFERVQVFAPGPVAGGMFSPGSVVAVVFAPGCVGQVFFPHPVAADTFAPHATAAQIGCGCNC